MKVGYSAEQTVGYSAEQTVDQRVAQKVDRMDGLMVFVSAPRLDLSLDDLLAGKAPMREHQRAGC